MPTINFVVARNDAEAQSLANSAYVGCSTITEARKIAEILNDLQKTRPVPLAPEGEYAIYAVRHEVKRLSDSVGDA